MKHIPNRFEWIAAGWILIGLFDLLILILVYSAMTFDDQYPPVMHAVVIASIVCCIGWIAGSYMMADRRWTRLVAISLAAIFLGIAHAVGAFGLQIVLWNRGGTPPGIVKLTIPFICTISCLLIVTGVYTLICPSVYFQARAERRAKNNTASVEA